MGNLSAFLAQNAIAAENVRYAASPRFVDPKTKEPLEWEVRPITSEQDESLRRECTKNTPVPGKRGQYLPQLDTNQYLARLAAACTAYPDLNDKELQDSYHVMGAPALVKAMLLPGEYAAYLQKVQSVCGFDIAFEDRVEEAKN